MTASQITSLIAAKTVAIKAEERKIASWIPQEASWRSASNKVCDQALKKNRDACNKDKTHKRSRADEFKSNINAARTRIVDLRKEVDQLLASQSANDQVEINLSKEGTSYDATILEAQGKAKESEAKANATSKKSNAYVFGLVGLVLLVGLGVIIKLRS